MNAILQTQPEVFETIYDHQVTDDEIIAMNDGYLETREEYFEALDHDSAMASLYYLYSLRGDAPKALFFMEQIRDNGFKFQFKVRPCCSVHS